MLHIRSELHGVNALKNAQSAVPAGIQAATALRVVVAHTGRFFWTNEFGRNGHWQESGCFVKDRPLECHYVSHHHAHGNATAEALLADAGVYVNYVCWNTSEVPAAMQRLPQVLHTMETISNFPCILQQPAAYNMSFYTNANVWVPYWRFPANSLASSTDEELQLLRTPPIPFQHQLHAIFYVCNTPHSSSGRHGLVEQLQATLKASNSSLAIHSYGTCNPNVDAAANKDFRTDTGQYEKYAKKVAYMRKYRFCLVLENSLDRDYVTEKVYHAFIAGCLPIYWGAPNFADFIPDADSVVDYAALGSVEALRKELERLAGDEAAYAKKFVWKARPLSSWSGAFQRLIALSRESHWCRLCRFVAQLTA